VTRSAESFADRPANAAEPDFGVEVPDSGYRWWYVDGVSEDGRQGVVVIAFVGSVFSPYYFRARRRGLTPAANHCAVNVALYRPRGKLWCMTERGRSAVQREPDRFRVGPSGLRWRGDTLEIDVDERSMPFGRRMRGRILLRPAFLNAGGFALDPAGQHRWRPVAPLGRLEVDFAHPGLRWRGSGYFDTNAGSRALEADFSGWNWSRFGGDESARITYAARLLGGAESSLALEIDGKGEIRRTPVPPEVSLPTTGWRVGRTTRSHEVPVVVRTLEDTPFYSRSLLAENAGGVQRIIMHESLSLERFSAAWVRLLLPFRMPRMPG